MRSIWKQIKLLLQQQEELFEVPIIFITVLFIILRAEYFGSANFAMSDLPENFIRSLYSYQSVKI